MSKVPMRTRTTFKDSNIDTFLMFEELHVILPGQKFKFIEGKQTVQFSLQPSLIDEINSGKRDGQFRNEIQFRVWNFTNSEDWAEIYLCIEVNNYPVFVPQPSPHIIYITAYCALEKNFSNHLKISSPRPEVLENFAFCLSIVARFTPAEIIEQHPLKEVFNATKALANNMMNGVEDRRFALGLYDLAGNVINEPCRSNVCDHPEVFDLETFLKNMQYNLQWKCPICAKKIKYQDLEIDRFLKRMKMNGKTVLHFYKRRNPKKFQQMCGDEIICEQEIIVID
ncbi:uncharacterized protein NPIL_257041 [Nephila pilipes]|uniref:SP-RING-type domain-containing protein n=1 Tax=Nephila pilipes TaxID=299642 RepID=A0A8X6NGD6_NEPPI|nr:uncharacterized protein NPIL_257041 [Nephila pilipes]